MPNIINYHRGLEFIVRCKKMKLFGKVFHNFLGELLDIISGNSLAHCKESARSIKRCKENISKQNCNTRRGEQVDSKLIVNRSKLLTALNYAAPLLRKRVFSPRSFGGQAHMVAYYTIRFDSFQNHSIFNVFFSQKKSKRFDGN